MRSTYILRLGRSRAPLSCGADTPSSRPTPETQRSYNVSQATISMLSSDAQTTRQRVAEAFNPHPHHICDKGEPHGMSQIVEGSPEWFRRRRRVAADYVRALDSIEQAAAAIERLVRDWDTLDDQLKSSLLHS